MITMIAKFNKKVKKPSKEEQRVIDNYQDYLFGKEPERLDTATHLETYLSETATVSDYPRFKFDTHGAIIYSARYYGSREDRKILRKFGYMDKDFNPTFKK